MIEGGVPQKDVIRIRKRDWASDTPSVRLLLVEIRAKRKNIWGECETCEGTLTVPNPNPAVAQLYAGVDLYQEWEPVEPPTGTGWQLWSGKAPEGYPVSPVCETVEDFARWCARRFKTRYAKWVEWAKSEDAQNKQPETPTFKLRSDVLRVFMAPMPNKVP